MNSTASQPFLVNCGGASKNPSPVASRARNPTDASIANALTGSVGYLLR